mmetsp:Transcript_55630/g.166698  ORF Transcript_55630/g.166698 Transcript_55630/m.166698 type:complete len:275 (-) Transcript_55630:407-1231(-)
MHLQENLQPRIHFVPLTGLREFPLPHVLCLGLYILAALLELRLSLVQPFLSVLEVTARLGQLGSYLCLLLKGFIKLGVELGKGVRWIREETWCNRRDRNGWHLWLRRRIREIILFLFSAIIFAVASLLEHNLPPSFIARFILLCQVFAITFALASLFGLALVPNFYARLVLLCRAVYCICHVYVYCLDLHIVTVTAIAHVFVFRSLHVVFVIILGGDLLSTRDTVSTQDADLQTFQFVHDPIVRGFGVHRFSPLCCEFLGAGTFFNGDGDGESS